MLNRLILLSGSFSSGKTTLAQGLAKHYAFDIIRTNDVFHSKIRNGSEVNVKILQDEDDKCNKETNGQHVLNELEKWVSPNSSTKGVIVDSVNIIEQIKAINEEYWPHVIHIHLTATKAELERRYSGGSKSGSNASLIYESVNENPTMSQVESLLSSADLVIDTKRCTIDDVLSKAVSYLDIEMGTGRGYVDVVVGGQYGSEGKGQICAHLSEEYDILVRVGGPNAGHSVYEGSEKYIYHMLPSGTKMNQIAKIILGPGIVLDRDILLKEIKERGITENRLSIDPHAMIITKEDKEREKGLVMGIGSTGQGAGAATARRIMDRSEGSTLAKDCKELEAYVRNTSSILEEAFKQNKKVLLEGTQGTGLSLYHGPYPYVTSRDTTVAGCLSEAGIAPRMVRKVILVCRVYPIRVQNPCKGTSGPLNQEITWKEVADRSGYSEEVLIKNEKTSTTNRQRRVGEFEWAMLHHSAILNGATDIALTFTDYINKDNNKARRYEQLTSETKNFIQEVERVANAPVSLISTGFNLHSVIDRRIW
jgi:adenylosuccinate synthase